MQLLKKSTVQLEVQGERRRRIDEGVKIAEKVDVLRETLASLEAQHQKFLDGVEGELQARTKPLIQKIASLQTEIGELEEKRKELLAPLTQEWTEVKRRQAELDGREIALEKRNVNLTQKEEKQIAQGIKLKNSLFGVKTQERELIKARNLADENLYISEEKRDEALKQKQESDEYVREAQQSLLEREAGLAVRERELENLRIFLKEKGEEQDNRERAIDDKYKTLLRTQKRLKNG